MVIAEYLHVVTDPKRFDKPLEMEAALTQIEEWTSAVEVSLIRGSDAADLVFLQWMRELNLGRKPIRDTRLAAQYYCSGATTLLTSNKADFEVYGVFSFMET